MIRWAIFGVVACYYGPFVYPVIFHDWRFGLLVVTYIVAKIVDGAIK